MLPGKRDQANSRRNALKRISKERMNEKKEAALRLRVLAPKVYKKEIGDAADKMANGKLMKMRCPKRLRYFAEVIRILFTEAITSEAIALLRLLAVPPGYHKRGSPLM